MCAVSLPAAAQPRGKSESGSSKATPPRTDKPAAASDRKSGPAQGKEKNFDFNNLNLNGQLRTPQLLYFLERANEELERASLEKRSFIPHIVRSVEDEAL